METDRVDRAYTWQSANDRACMESALEKEGYDSQYMPVFKRESTSLLELILLRDGTKKR